MVVMVVMEATMVTMATMASRLTPKTLSPRLRLTRLRSLGLRMTPCLPRCLLRLRRLVVVTMATMTAMTVTTASLLTPKTLSPRPRLTHLRSLGLRMTQCLLRCLLQLRRSVVVMMATMMAMVTMAMVKTVRRPKPLGLLLLLSPLRKRRLIRHWRRRGRKRLLVHSLWVPALCPQLGPRVARTRR